MQKSQKNVQFSSVNVRKYCREIYPVTFPESKFTFHILQLSQLNVKL